MDSPRIVATYRITGAEGAIRERATALALEQSVELPLEAVPDDQLVENIVARVGDITPAAGGAHLVKLGLSIQTIGDDAGQLMNMLFGNSSLHSDVELVDVEVPEGLAKQFGGPRLGISGLRDLTGVRGRALTCSALKPIGSSPAQLAELCRTFARAGVDLIKDDHGWANQPSAPFEARVRACQDAVAEGARDGTGTIYLPSLFGHDGQMQQQIDFARALGVRAFLIAPMICGVATFNALARANRDVAFMAHPALAGAARIAPGALLGKLFRLFGADATIFPNHGGRFAFSRAACDSIAKAARSPWHGLHPAFPVPAGGMSVERVPELLGEYGRDTVLLIGGSLLVARDQLFERACAFVRAVAGPRPVEAAA
jgi:ribulose-bisphosphate carboxylase large chain